MACIVDALDNTQRTLDSAWLAYEFGPAPDARIRVSPHMSLVHSFLKSLGGDL